jgi:hypothetical protein
MKHSLCGLLLLLACAAPARAHFVWIVPDADKGTAMAVFSDELAPDKSVPVTKIGHTEFFTRDAAGKTVPVKATAGKGFYEVTLPKGTSAVGGVCRYGVTARGKGDPFLLVYHAWAWIPGTDDKDAAQRSPWDRIALQVVPTKKPNTGQVLWNGKPLAGAEVVARVPGHDNDIEAKSDANGEFQIPAPKGTGMIAIRALHVEAKAGEHDGMKYQQVRHWTTAVFPVRGAVVYRPAAAAPQKEADPAATKLLADARSARASWDGFPGFSADLAVNVNGKLVTGRVEVSEGGKVKVDLPDDAMRDWARGQLASVVGHRMPAGSGDDTPCAFIDTNDKHPLGRAIRVLNDELHSSYRIRGREIIEVNRSMKTSRFTITVLENRWTAEKKYLPVSYVVNTWDGKTGALISSAAFHHEWRRVGAFDLPGAMTVVTATGDTSGPLAARTIALTNHKLSR